MFPRSANSLHFAVCVQSDCPSLWKELQVPEMHTLWERCQDVRLWTPLSAGCVVTMRRAWGKAGHLASPCPSLSCWGSRPITRRPGPQPSCGKSHTVLPPLSFVQIHVTKCTSSWVSEFLVSSSPGSTSATLSERGICIPTRGKLPLEEPKKTERRQDRLFRSQTLPHRSADTSAHPQLPCGPLAVLQPECPSRSVSPLTPVLLTRACPRSRPDELWAVFRTTASLRRAGCRCVCLVVRHRPVMRLPHHTPRLTLQDPNTP